MKSKYCYFEDYQLGQEGETITRTIGEPEISRYACLVGDFAPLHVNRYYAESHLFRTRIAHGPLGMNIAVGLLSLGAPQVVGEDVPGAYFCSFDVNYRDVIRLGDSIKVKWRVSEKVDDPAQQGFGLVKTTWEMLNQEGKATYNGTVVTKVRKESASDVELQLKPGQPTQIKEFVWDPERIYYLEDYAAGEGVEIAGRTITEADIVNFCSLVGDYNGLYLDAEYAKGSVFRERVAPGMMVASLVGAYFTRTPLYQCKRPEGFFAGPVHTLIRFLAPARIGDTIRCQYQIEGTQVSKSKPDRGLLTIGRHAINQRNELIVEQHTMFMRATRALASKT